MFDWLVMMDPLAKLALMGVSTLSLLVMLRGRGGRPGPDGGPR
jgi:hypothetical protein